VLTTPPPSIAAADPPTARARRRQRPTQQSCSSAPAFGVVMLADLSTEAIRINFSRFGT
jgi:hypothetical protein